MTVVDKAGAAKSIRFAYINNDVFQEMVCDAHLDDVPKLKFVLLPGSNVKEDGVVRH